MSEVLSESGSVAGPHSPAAYSPTNTAAREAHLQGNGVRSSPPLAADSKVAEARKEGLARPRPACPRGLWEEDRSGRGGWVRPAQN